MAGPRDVLARGDGAVGIVGTFDVENYGDLLFPLIAAAALRRRDPRVAVRAYSATPKTADGWPYAVGSPGQLADDLPGLATLLVGGGQIVRFDRRYPVPVPADVEVPFAYWLTPAAQAALVGTPVIWNAVGVSLGWPRASWHTDLVRDVLSASAFIGVRDLLSQRALRSLAPAADIQVVPDTAFGVSRLWPLEGESPAFAEWRRTLDLAGRYVVVQATAATRPWRAEIEALAARARATIVVLPVCWCHGDRVALAPAFAGPVVASAGWLPPPVLTEILGRAECVVASSLHASITAISYGVPVARVRVYWGPSKYDQLDPFTGVAGIDEPAALSRLLARGRGIEPLAAAQADRLERYWDVVADMRTHWPAERRAQATGTMLRWAARAVGSRQRPGRAHAAQVWLRDAGSRHFVEERMTVRRWMAKAVAWGRAQGRPGVAGPAGTPGPSPRSRPRDERPVLDVTRLEQRAMHTAPFAWAFIDGLFAAGDAAALAATFPHDRFRSVTGHDGEKDYEYQSRSLVHMGAAVTTHREGLSQAWRALAEDLLSAEYRAAVSRLTGRDLTAAPVEVNVLHYGRGAWLGPHLDLQDKVVTHVLYFNETWDPALGGCLNVLNSKDPDDVHATIAPLVGNSVLLVRSPQSWHSVSRVAPQCRTSRRSVNVIFHRPGSVSTMWPPGAAPALHDLTPAS